MKKTNFKISKNIKIAVSGGLIALAVILSVQLVVDAQSIQLVTDQGNSGAASIAKMQLSPKEESDGNLPELNFDNNDFNFRLYGTAILDNTIALGDAYFSKGLYAGYAEISDVTPPQTDFQINGNIIIKELRDPLCVDAASCAAIPDRQLCTNDFGVLMRC